jgi:hypothetical protein
MNGPLLRCALAFSALGIYAQAPGGTQGVSLNNESLLKTLTDMGLSPKPLSKGYLVLITQDSWKLYVQFVLSSNQEKLGMNANLGLVNEETVTADQWKALLISNGDIDPSVFFYDSAQKKLYLHRVLDNHALTPAFLRTQLDNFVANIRSTDKLWTAVTH